LDYEYNDMQIRLISFAFFLSHTLDAFQSYI
jgi:hypothetical protein